MKKILSTLAAAALGLAVLAPTPARAGADLCLQFSGGGCDLTGDIGFFHFTGKLPKNIKKAESLPGRACHTGTVNAAASMNLDGTFINIHGTFNCDATNGNVNAYLSVATGTAVGAVHTGDGDYGEFTNFNDCVVTVVDCAASEMP